MQMKHEGRKHDHLNMVVMSDSYSKCNYYPPRFHLNLPLSGGKKGQIIQGEDTSTVVSDDKFN